MIIHTRSWIPLICKTFTILLFGFIYDAAKPNIKASGYFREVFQDIDLQGLPLMILYWYLQESSVSDL